MQCEDIGEKISAYLDGELETETRREIELHLRRCSECQALFEDFKQLHHAILQMPSIEPGPDFVRQVLTQVEEGIGIGKTTHDKPPSIIIELIRVVEALLEKLGIFQPAYHGHLAEFNDFPPNSMGDIYCRLMAHPTRC
jgi:hypothetical protein